MNEKEFREKFNRNQAKNYEVILRIQDEYNEINISELATSGDEKQATKRIIEILKERVPDARAKDINDFFLEIAREQN